MLTPLALDPARPFPRIQNKSLNFIVQVKGKDAFGRNTTLAIVQAPRSLPRIIRVPSEGGQRDFIYLSAIVEAFVAKLFAGMEVLGCYQFRVTRNSDLFVDEEEVDDLLRARWRASWHSGATAKRCASRRRTTARVTSPTSCCNQFALTPSRSVPGRWPGQPQPADGDLRSRRSARPQVPGLHRRDSRAAAGQNDLFAVIRTERRAAASPVSELHAGGRTSCDRPQRIPRCSRSSRRCIAPAPIHRSSMRWSMRRRRGKDVTVIIELRARFDEEANIELATRLQEAGAHVMYGVVGYKTHAKLIMVVRREGGRLRRYCHIGTGNYHSRPRALTPTTASSPATKRSARTCTSCSCSSRASRRRRSCRSCCSRRSRCTRRSMAKIAREAEHARAGTQGAHHRQDECADRSRDHSQRCTKPRAPASDRPHRARHLRAAARAYPASRRISACARSSAASSSTRACTTS